MLESSMPLGALLLGVSFHKVCPTVVIHGSLA